MASKKKKTTVDITQETSETIRLLKKAYNFKSTGQVIDLSVQVFYKAYLERISEIGKG